jgi:hypothetical protein
MPASLVAPPSVRAPAPHTWPAIKQPVVPGASGSLHVPTAAPDCLVQIPPQHSMSFAQTSPVCVQNDGLAEHLPFAHSSEQHSLWPLQVFPAVLHSVFSGRQLPELQLPLQHSASLVQVWLSETHTVEPQVPPSQTSVQHSVGDEQASPDALHSPTGFVQTFRTGSQFAKQQSSCDEQVALTSRH